MLTSWIVCAAIVASSGFNPDTMTGYGADPSIVPDQPAAQTMGDDALLTFDDISGAVGSQYSGVTFSAGWTVWNSVGNPYYPPHSDPNVAYTHETSNYIDWDDPIGGLSFYASCYDGYGDTYYYTAYDAAGNQLEQISTTGGPNVLIAFSASGISKLVVTGTGSWNTHHTVDDMAYGAAAGLEVVLSGYPGSVARGGTVSFQADAVNNGDTDEVLDEAKLFVTGPASLTKTLYSGPDITVPAGGSVGAPVSLPVPQPAPLGVYNVEVVIYDNGSEISSDDFDITVTD